MHQFFGQRRVKMLTNFKNKKTPINFFMGVFGLLYFTGQAPVAHSASTNSSKLLVLFRSTTPSTLT